MKTSAVHTTRFPRIEGYDIEILELFETLQGSFLWRFTAKKNNVRYDCIIMDYDIWSVNFIEAIPKALHERFN